jgi:succinyl-CoA synthetase beta subunit
MLRGFSWRDTRKQWRGRGDRFRSRSSVRLEGTNVEEGQRVLRDSALKFTVAGGMKDAARKRSSRWLTQQQAAA